MDRRSFFTLTWLMWGGLAVSHAPLSTPVEVPSSDTTTLDPKGTSQDFSVVLPKVLYRSENKSVLVVLLSNVWYTFTLQLELNSGLLTLDFLSKHYGYRGDKKEHTNCFYHGTVVGHPDWTVSISTCQGLRGFFGNVHEKKQSYHLEPLNGEDNSMERPHRVHTLSDHQDRKLTCGTKGQNYTPAITIATNQIISGGSLDKSLHRRHRLDTPDLYVEWIIVNDHSQYLNYNSNITAVVLRATEVANFVDMVYKELNIRVVLVDMVTWTNGDKIAVVTDANTLLDNFREYQSDVQMPHDSIMLITGIDLDGPTAGIAFKSTMCDDKSSVSLIQDSGFEVESVGSLAAHELGHIFNMDHDGENCGCSDASDTCIMAAVSGIPPSTEWSDCSKQDLEEGFLLYNLNWCLTNEPNITDAHPMCGNGIREGDEACDCGNQEECVDPCCDALTCQLIPGAQCNSGECCTAECQFSPYGVPCRVKLNECDLVEYCSGNTSTCPADVGIQDGSPCDNGEAYCFSGTCRTHSRQCHEAFGEASGKGEDICYTNWNTRGDEFGNCGYTAADYLPCNPSDVFCGQLHCVPSNFQLNVHLPVTVLSTTTTLLNGSKVQCSSFTSDPGLDTVSPGLVQDGTNCGDKMVCYKQKCIHLTQLQLERCATGSNRMVCSGNGQCNNQGKCSCNVGYLGDTCETVLSGDLSDSEAGLKPVITVLVTMLVMCISVLSLYI